MSRPGHLLAFRFVPGAEFEGRLVGALERIESAGAPAIFEALFVGRHSQTGELAAITVTNRQAGGFVAPALSFRLDAAERAELTRRAVRVFERDGEPNLVTALGELLEPGESIAAVLVEDEWARVLDDAVARTGGITVVSEPTSGTRLEDVAAALVTAAATSPAPAQGSADLPRIE